MTPGIAGQLAPALEGVRWLTADGEPSDALQLKALGTGYNVLFFFQDQCPGCHSSGFPTLIRLVHALSPRIGFAAVQTVFEDVERNTFDRARANQQRYNLRIPVGHAAPGPGLTPPVLMTTYRSGGTPWFVVIDPAGRVVFDGFGLDADAVISALQAHGND